MQKEKEYEILLSRSKPPVFDTRIRKDIRGWIGWDYIKEMIKICTQPLVLLLLFLTGGRATEVLKLTRAHFSDLGGYYAVTSMPVLKKYIVTEVYMNIITGKKRYETVPRPTDRSFPILKNELSNMLWDIIKDRDRLEPLLHWPNFKSKSSQYWQVYKTIHDIEMPPSPLAPLKDNKKDWRDPSNQRRSYPHWSRGMRAAQMRVEYNFSVAQLMDFFMWEDISMARHYAKFSVADTARAMQMGLRFNEIWDRIMEGRE